MTTLSGDATAAHALAGKLGRAGAALADLDAPNEEAGRVVLAAARPPRRTGTLEAGMFARTDTAGVIVASSAPYFTFVEYGAPRVPMRANPYTREALTRTTTEVVGIYAAHRDRAIGLIT